MLHSIARMPSFPRHGGRRALLAALLACALTASATAQQQPSPPGSDDAGGNSWQDDQISTAMVALLAAVVAVFVFIAASIVYLRHCSGHSNDATASSWWRSPSGNDAVPGLDNALFFSSRSWWQRRRQRRGSSRGLDAEAIEAFPTMTYAEAKALRVGKTGDAALECAVCLSEFEEGDKLRLLLPKCSHAFHPDCIGEWLAGHVTCPVCRCNLEPSGKVDTTSSDGTIPLASSVSSETVAAAWRDGGSVPVAVVIDVVTEEEEEEEERRQEEAMELQRIGTQRRAMRSRSGRQPLPTTAQHSTGNALAARLDRDLERFTLRLPENVSREMVASASEHSLQLRLRRERAEGGRSEPLGRSGIWESLVGRTTLSGKLSFFLAPRTMTPSSGEDGEVSSSSLYSYTRLRGRRVAAVVDVPAEGEGSTCHDRAGVGGSGSDDAKAAAADASSEVAAAADEEKAVKQ